MATTRFSRRNRDAGLRRVTTITQWAAAGAFAATGVFAGLAAHVGRVGAVAKSGSGGTGTTRRSAPATDANPTANNGGDDSGGGFGQSPVLQAPAQAPTVQPSQSGGFAPIVSGAS
jgi:hypothetical protein